MKSTTSSKGGLYIVSTPIGNMSDITFRAVDTLKNADIIACEDTRVTRKLLSHYGIDTKMISYNDHNANKVRRKILRDLECGMMVALVSDAGTPLISDPGYKLLNEAVNHGAYVTTIPGASSVTAALTLAGLPTNRFLFEGFLPPTKIARQKALEEIKFVNGTIIFLERNSRIIKTLQDIYDVFGDRAVAVTREITKTFEEVKRGDVQDLISFYEKEGTPKGEVVILVSPPENKRESLEDVDEFLKKALPSMSLKEAVATAASQFNIPKKEIYSQALKIKDFEVLGDDTCVAKKEKD